MLSYEHAECRPGKVPPKLSLGKTGKFQIMNVFSKPQASANKTENRTGPRHERPMSDQSQATSLRYTGSRVTRLKVRIKNKKGKR